MRPSPSMLVRAVAVMRRVLRELPDCVQLRGPGSHANQAFRCGVNSTTSTVGTFIGDCLSAASTEMIRL